MTTNEKKFPPPRKKEAVAPYRQAAPAPPPLLPIEVKSAPIVEAPESRDLLEELEKVEVDPRALEEARSSNRAWGAAAFALGVVLVVFGIALDLTMWNASRMHSRVITMPGIGFVLVAYGIRKWRTRGIDY